MFFANQNQENREQYIKLLKTLGSLSNLFSESEIPYLYYRGAEKVFCKAFGALDHSRGDTAIDAGLGDIGIGLKTFLDGNGTSFQKVAEFNKDGGSLLSLNPSDLVLEISKLRNKRLDFAKNLHGVDNLIYHCVTRKHGKFLLCEESMDFVDIDKIRDIDFRGNTIHFNDSINAYCYSKTKSTLLKKFISSPIYEFDVEILTDPFEYLDSITLAQTRVLEDEILHTNEKIVDSVILPLYSEKGGIHVPERSGLNQWNARGRPRSRNEAYIPIPINVHRINPGFFPEREQSFELILPTGEVVLASVCQDNSKALMSNPNSKLGGWLINDVLKIPEGQIVTYDNLLTIGIDSVEITKLDDGKYAINFKGIGEYENFKNKLQIEEELDDE